MSPEPDRRDAPLRRGGRTHSAVAAVAALAGLPPLGAAVYLWRSSPGTPVAGGVLAAALLLGPGLGAWLGARMLRRTREIFLEQNRILAENIRSLEETNRELARARATLVQAEKMASVGRLAAGVAHEVGNPLSAILTYLDLVERRGSAEGLIEDIRGEARRIDRIVSGLLDFARPAPEAERVVSAGEVARGTVELLQTQGQLDAVSVGIECEAGLPGVRADPDRLRQVLVNLLLNARDAVLEAPEGGGGIEVVIEGEVHQGDEVREFSPRRDDDPEEVDYSHLRRSRAPAEELLEPELAEGQRVVRIAIRDEGPGIPEEASGRLFDPFFTTKEPGRGTGLGLAVSARLVGAMGGTLHAATRPEGGAEFTLELPVEEEGEG